MIHTSGQTVRDMGRMSFRVYSTEIKGGNDEDTFFIFFILLSTFYFSIDVSVVNDNDAGSVHPERKSR